MRNRILYPLSFWINELKFDPFVGGFLLRLNQVKPWSYCVFGTGLGPCSTWVRVRDLAEKFYARAHIYKHLFKKPKNPLSFVGSTFNSTCSHYTSPTFSLSFVPLSTSSTRSFLFIFLKLVLLTCYGLWVVLIHSFTPRLRLR